MASPAANANVIGSSHIDADSRFSTLETVEQPHHGYAENLASGTLQVDVHHNSGRPLDFPVVDPEKNGAGAAVLQDSSKNHDHRSGTSRSTTRWVLIAIAAILVIGGIVGGAVGGTLARRHSSHSSSASYQSPPGVITSSSSLSSSSSPSPASSTSASSSSSPSSSISSAATPTPSAAFSATSSYRLTNAFLGPNTSLNVLNGGSSASAGTLFMSTTGNISTQLWRLVPSFSSGGTITTTTYTISSQALGDQRVLGVLANSVLPSLQDKKSNSPGQTWSAESWGDGTWRLTNAENGDTLHLDTYSDTHQPFMGDGNHSGQHWTITVD